MYYILYGSLVLIAFFLGIYFEKRYCVRNILRKILIYIFKLGKRFSRHIISLTGIYIILIIAYIISTKVFNNSDYLLPNLISTGLSVVFIDFLVKERELKDKEKVSVLIDTKVVNITNRISKVILKFMNLPNLEKETLSCEMIKNILEQDELEKENITYVEFKDDGQVQEKTINKFDYIYYVAKEIRPDVNILIQNFSQFLSTNKMICLINLLDLFDKNNIFKAKYSTYSELTQDEKKVFKNILIDVVCKLNDILNLLNESEKKNGYK